MRTSSWKYHTNILLGKLGYRISQISNSNELQNLIRRLHPIEFQMIRIGGDGDGGYLVPDDLKDIKYCFSPGVSDSSNFEIELAERGVVSFLADFSVESPPVSNHLLKFEKKFVGPYESEKVMNFEHWIAQNSRREDELILQMDIEGDEYQTLLSCNNEILRQFRIMVIEFHHLDLLFDKKAFPIIASCFYKILSEFDVVHIHPNNAGQIKVMSGNEIPTILEFTFLRSDRLKSRKRAVSFPHKLDRSNVPSKIDFRLPKGWYEK